MTMKKIWKTPQLTVLVRSRPEESVLLSCKYQGGKIDGPNNIQCKGDNNNDNGDCRIQVPT